MSLNQQPARLRSPSPQRRIGLRAGAGIELLESRQLLSACLPTAHRNMTLTPAATAAVSGYTPAQIRHAYGFDQVAGTGAGQTIAIVDAFNDPNIAADLHAFDQQFGIGDPASFKVVNQAGGSVASVPTDSGWSSEIALDVEWAHAVAPQANILLVEANSDSFNDLMAGVDYARHAAGVSAVSMSWGGDEFWGETQYDKYFTTPTGHTGVTFVASSGDSGSWYGPEWPSSSPNVLSVGGTSLRTMNSGGAYGGETGWSGSGGGISSYEREPSFQSGAQSTGGRTSPDVSYNADPYTGFAVYSSVPDGGYVGWEQVGGTSAGSPQWAALVAIANQTRASAGKAPLDGATGTLPALYKLYSAPGSASYSTYTANFNDVTQGRSSYYYSAHSGYDGVTGLGSPKVARVVAVLAGSGTAPTAIVTTTTSVNQYLRLRLGVAATRPQSMPSEALNVLPPHPVNAAPALSFARELLSSGTVLQVTGVILPTGHEIDSLHSMSISADDGVEASLPAPGQAVLATTAQVMATAVGVGETTVQTLDAATATVLDLGRMDAVATFADAAAGFAHDSASLGTAIAQATSHAGAWAATFAVLGIDAVLIGYWRASRRSSKRVNQPGTARRTTFSLQRV